MINNNNESRGKCALCGRTFTEPKEGEKSFMIQEVIDGTPYKFDKMDCIPMFKRLEVYMEMISENY
ncbi:MAG: hypothetical protein DLM72_07495 [Candidatus Nitrosopolaris wilkensis]|nr:MAG: hypothetical protein DLM72_07495 [Candidatus Nitrosopolaris wilkensis]